VERWLESYALPFKVMHNSTVLSVNSTPAAGLRRGGSAYSRWWLRSRIPGPLAVLVDELDAGCL
jgi:hypothetical protein